MSAVYVAFLFKVGRNCATVGLGGSECIGMSDYESLVDIRKPSLLDRNKCSSLMEGLDRGLPPITNWQQLYQWLGRGSGWAYFSPESAAELLQHWFTAVEYKSQQQIRDGIRSGPFFDTEALHGSGIQLENAGEMMGPDAETFGETQRVFDQFADNFIITRQPLFVV